MFKNHNRKLERKSLVYFPEVVNRATGDHMGRIIDLTVEGFLIVGDKKLEEGFRFEATISWVDEFKKETTLTCEIEVVWSKKDVNPDYIASGCRIYEITDENKESIKRLIRKWGFPSWK